MIQTFKNLSARAIFPIVIAAGIGFGILAAGVAAVLGGLILMGVRLDRETTKDTAPAEPAIAQTSATAAHPA